MSTNGHKSNLPAFRTGAPKGNQNATSHGIYATTGNSLKLRHRRVKRLVDKAYMECPWLQRSDLPTVRSWAETVVLKAVCFAVLQQSNVYRVDLVSGDVMGKRLLLDWSRLSSLELAYAKELGFTPAARASLGLDIAKGKFFKERLAEHGDYD